MYRRYYNEYEKKAQQIKSQAAAVLPAEKPEIKKELKAASSSRMPTLNFDDILILGLIFFLIKEGNADKTLILALGFIFISGF